MRTQIGVIVGALALAGCTYGGGDMGDPVTRKFHWFSYVAGDDIKATCQAGSPDRFRLVYNGRYDQQLRLYDLDSVRQLLIAKVTRPGNAAKVSVDDLLAPWRATEAKTPLDQPAYQSLVAAFAEAGMFGPPAVGRELPSHGFHWAAASCKDGQFRFTGWAYPETDLMALPFVAPLLAADGTAIAINPPGPIAFDPQYEDNLKRGLVTSFNLKVGENGMVR
ncbi:MAG: hypothetical protein AB7G62_16470 [Magnetospirillum sp.]